MISNMEKFINFKQLRVVKTGTTTSSGKPGLTLTDSGAFFTQSVLPNAIVWDRTTNGSNGGEMYLVNTVTSDTELALTPIGPTSSQGDGVAISIPYYIYMPEYTVKASGTDDALLAYALVDTSVNFRTLGVQNGDTVLNITDATTATVTGFGVPNTNPGDTLTLDADIFDGGGDDFIVYRAGADDLDTIMRSADVALVEVDPSTYTATGNNSAVDFIYNPNPASHSRVIYAYSDTVGGAGAQNEDMRNALQDAVVASLETPWSEVAYDFPGLLNPASGTNATWLAGRNYFILEVSINLP